jgi:hypothetical protein
MTGAASSATRRSVAVRSSGAFGCSPILASPSLACPAQAAAPSDSKSASAASSI